MADATTNAMGLAYFEVNRNEIMDRMKKHGAVLFRLGRAGVSLVGELSVMVLPCRRGFDVTKTPEGFRAAWQAMGLNPCLDPIHNSGLRTMLSKKWVPNPLCGLRRPRLTHRARGQGRRV